MENIIGASERMASVINDLLKLFGIARQKINFEKVNLSQIAEACLAELATAWPHRAAKIVIKPGVIAEADPGLCRVLIENLVRNAWKFSSKKDVSRIEFGEEIKEETMFVR
jgi:signal transduction histidine kinase